MNKKILLNSLILLLFSSPVFAQILGQKCDRILTHSGNIQIWREWSIDKRICEVSIHPMSVQDLVYRDYYVSSVGTVMVFNSYGDGPDSQTTGAREFVFLPRLNSYIDVTILPNEDVQVGLVSGQKMIFDSTTAQLKSLSDGTVKVAKNISKNNSGGVEILTSTQPWIDFGFRMGSSPMGQLSGSNTVKDKLGNACKLKNKDFMMVIDQDPQFYLSDPEIKILLAAKCAAIKY